MQNTSLNFDIDELIRLDGQVSDSYHAIDSNLSRIKSCFDELRSNVTGTQVNGLITTISDKISGIDSKLDSSFEELAEFLKGQMANYATTYEGALAILNKALEFIDSNFQEI